MNGRSFGDTFLGKCLGLAVLVWLLHFVHCPGFRFEPKATTAPAFGSAGAARHQNLTRQ